MTTTAPCQVRLETRPLAPALQTVSQMGKSRALLSCPFCSAQVWAYTWSRAGGGKKCACGVILYMREAVRWSPPPPRVRRRKK